MEQSPRSNRHPPGRSVLAERQPRMIQTSPSPKISGLCTQEANPRLPHHTSLKLEGNLSASDQERTQLTTAERKPPSAVGGDDTGSNRASRFSTASTASAAVKGKRKTHVGPWQLGKTLGKGATGRVRLGRRTMLVEGKWVEKLVAIKIVSKKSVSLVQSRSMANMDKSESPLLVAGQRTIPFGIEREVVIMKLISHPHVIQLYDVWENRGELYLVLEYVSGGELFDYVSRKGALREHEAVRLFRQIIGGLSYCHRFNICHRDLKPENLLLDENKDIKLADFGMAALQPTGKLLNTSCGSPHYAAPEVISGKQYRGATADIWSVGIILYAMLNGYLPFDGGEVDITLRLVKRGHYNLPANLSPEATNLIQRILQKNPEDRITIEDMWTHPLLKKWEGYHTSILAKGTQLAGPAPPLQDVDCGSKIASRRDIDSEILRNLQTLWHGDKLEDIIKQLLCEEPSMEKLFYNALLRFRDEQLENYPGDPLHHSKSDYHHVSKPVRKPAIRGAAGGSVIHNRHNSQYSIVSEQGHARRDSYYKKPAAATSNTTDASYNPFHPSRTPALKSSSDSPTVIVRHGSSASKARHAAISRIQEEEGQLPATTSEKPNSRAHRKKLSHSSAPSRSSLASSRRELGIVKSASYKPNVIFKHKRHTSSGNATSGSNQTRLSRPASSGPDAHLRPTLADTNRELLDVSSMCNMTQTPEKVQTTETISQISVKKSRITSGIWRDDARKVSTELSKICEEAFNRSSVTPTEPSRTRLTHSRGSDSPATAASIHYGAAAGDKFYSRTLPETPEQHIVATAIQALEGTRKKIIENWGESDPVALANILENLDKRINLEREKSKQADQRAASDPTHTSTNNNSHDTTKRLGLPLYMNTMDDLMNRRQHELRSASDPVKNNKQYHHNPTVRLVSPDPMSPGVPLEPLQIRKKNQILSPLNSLRDGTLENASTAHDRFGYDSRIHVQRQLGTIDENPKSTDSKQTHGSVTTGRKWSSWLNKRSSVPHDETPPTPPRKNSPESKVRYEAKTGSSSEFPQDAIRPSAGICDAEALHATVETKKKWFRRMFARKEKLPAAGPLNDYAVLTFIEEDTESNGSDGYSKSTESGQRYPPVTSVDAATAAMAVQPIQISQNWFAKFFHIKPATRVLYLRISQRETKRVITKKLKEWRKYGLRDVAVERRAGVEVIRGRVDAQNYLSLKPVHFYCQLYSVLAGGRKTGLSVAKFTQEKGAASSFIKVVDTLEAVMGNEHLLVRNNLRKQKIKSKLEEAGII